MNLQGVPTSRRALTYRCVRFVKVKADTDADTAAAAIVSQHMRHNTALGPYTHAYIYTRRTNFTSKDRLVNENMSYIIRIPWRGC